MLTLVLSNTLTMLVYRKTAVLSYKLTCQLMFYPSFYVSGECIGQLSVNHRRGAGVLDLRFESPHELLACGYDTFIRMWDLRTQSWLVYVLFYTHHFPL